MLHVEELCVPFQRLGLFNLLELLQLGRYHCSFIQAEICI